MFFNTFLGAKLRRIISQIVIIFILLSISIYFIQNEKKTTNDNKVEVIYERDKFNEVLLENRKKISAPVLKIKVNQELSSNKIIGIKEIRDYLEGKSTLINAKEMIKQKTRQYAKRQFTWARGHMRSWETIYSSNFNDLFKKAIDKTS